MWIPWFSGRVLIPPHWCVSVCVRVCVCVSREGCGVEIEGANHIVRAWGGLGGWFVENRIGQEHVSTQSRQHDQNYRKNVRACIRRVQTCFVLRRARWQTASKVRLFPLCLFFLNPALSLQVHHLRLFTGLCGSTPEPVTSLGQTYACLKISCSLSAMNQILVIETPHGLAYNNNNNNNYYYYYSFFYHYHYHYHCHYHNHNNNNNNYYNYILQLLQPLQLLQQQRCCCYCFYYNNNNYYCYY